ncbi:MAG: DNA-processing protein DprA [bacterium]
MDANDKTDRLTWAALAGFPKLDSLKLRNLQKHFPQGDKILFADVTELMAAGLKSETAEALATARKEFDLEKLEKDLAVDKIEVIIFGDAEYPKRLAQIPDPPAVLFRRGAPLRNLPLLAVVGSRKMTPYGAFAIQKIVPELVARGFVIVSGLALGCDAKAHQEAADAGGLTLAVLGSGLNDLCLHPPSNRALARKILETDGSLLSEYSPGTPPLPYHFPVRNRIIAGLSLATIVIEAEEDSGSLITAHLALDYNREVFAVPGPISSGASLGTNRLLKMGAHPLTEVRDILEVLDFQDLEAEEKPALELNSEERLILENLQRNPMSVDELSESSKLPVPVLTSNLTMLELKGLVTRIGTSWLAKN